MSLWERHDCWLVEFEGGCRETSNKPAISSMKGCRTGHIGLRARQFGICRGYYRFQVREIAAEGSLLDM